MKEVIFGEIGPDQGKVFSQKELEEINFLNKMEDLSHTRIDEALAYEIEQMLLKNEGFYPDYWQRVVNRYGLKSGTANRWHWPKK